MRVKTTDRGFEIITHQAYPRPTMARLVQQSSVAREDSLDCPGSSALWIGDNFHLSRSEVAALVQHLQAWLETGSLELPEVAPKCSHDLPHGCCSLCISGGALRFGPGAGIIIPSLADDDDGIEPF